MKSLAIIPARGGSKGIPRKNLAQLHGRPLLSYCLKTARESRLINAIHVSTDDEEISQLALSYNATSIKRPSNLSGDTASSEDALLHALDDYRLTHKGLPDILVFLQATAPLLLPEDIDACIELVKSGEADSAFAAAPFHHFIWKQTSAGGVEGFNHQQTKRLHRQNITPQYIEAGSVYAMKVEGFLKAKHRFFGKIKAHPIPAWRCFEIDEPADIPQAELLLSRLTYETKRRSIPQQVEAIIFDFDGVLTDDRVGVLEDGSEFVICHRGDGLAFDALKDRAIKLLILSRESRPMVRHRAEKLKIECMNGVKEKTIALLEWAKTSGVALENTCYVGNDLNDLECMKLVGCSIAPLDAHEEVKQHASIILESKGGGGVAREIVSLLSKGGYQCHKL